jgi:uncharacterized protein
VTPGYPLEELFLALRCRGLMLGFREYQDAVTALAAGFGVGSRAELLAVLDALWARSDAESRTLAMLFADIPRPSTEKVTDYHLARAVGSPSEADRRLMSAPHSEPSANEPRVAVSFHGSDQRGLGIPQPIFSQSDDETFILTPQPPVTLRSLILAWRRFLVRQRIGPGRELDVEASIDQQCRTGKLISPVLKQQRVNQARLLLFIDSSSSMAAWSSLWPLWQESVAQGRLGAAAIYYFSNVPLDVLYLNPSLRDPLDLEETLRSRGKTPLLIFSDAGAARGSRNQDRIDQTQQFLNRARAESRSIVWINPLPPRRWRGTSAQVIVRQCRIPMLPLSDADLVRAVDLLRGVRTH